jgi:hypothetical protein
VRTFADEAIVLKTYNVGEADRFCLLLTRKSGRIAARAAGVRRTTSKRGAALLPLRRISLEYTFGRTGTHSVTQASCIDPYSECATCLNAFSCAEQGMEIVMNLIHEGEPVEEVYLLTREFLSRCSRDHSPALLTLFTLKLLWVLGTFPGGGDLAALPTDTTLLRGLSPAARAFIETVPSAALADAPACDPALLPELEGFARYLLGSQLGGSLKSPSVAGRLSPAPTPTR